MKNIVVKTNTKQYPIYIETDFNELVHAFKNAGFENRKICIITDDNVSPLYLEQIKTMLTDEVSPHTSAYIFAAGESSKTLDTVQTFYRFFCEQRLDRKAVVVALGGGVVGDMAGFAASTYMRGISFVQIPTTLLAMVDSSVGGKVGVDFLNQKNMIGAFYQPDFVYISIDTLKTLPKNQLAAGMAETIKYGFIRSEDFYITIVDNKEAIKELDTNMFFELINGSCKMKASVVAKDEREAGLREILNFGHTFGHAIETLSGFSLLHGECVAVGMIAALYLSYKKGNITFEQLRLAESILAFFDLPIEVVDFSPEDIYEQMFSDKKVKDDKINVVLLSEIGEAYTTDACTKEEMLEAIHYIVN